MLPFVGEGLLLLSDLFRFMDARWCCVFLNIPWKLNGGASSPYNFFFFYNFHIILLLLIQLFAHLRLISTGILTSNHLQFFNWVQFTSDCVQIFVDSRTIRCFTTGDWCQWTWWWWTTFVHVTAWCWSAKVSSHLIARNYSFFFGI